MLSYHCLTGSYGEYSLRFATNLMILTDNFFFFFRLVGPLANNPVTDFEKAVNKLRRNTGLTSWNMTLKRAL
ncbi:hypothetical protein MtrunA17_Chr5g0424011 [Medicago truncatula]|uniref:Uncharacterized protein n=1 Tax=Medicago truncatula TaxID=3880 RepID=A0A396HTV1_MEDTR|nr:hypothetical protein MtrunA17_Chr5g0424011 [Medicago truncatula]